MSKFNPSQFEDVLVDIRRSYRLIAAYQNQLNDIFRYILDRYSLTVNKGVAKFSTAAKETSKLNLNNWTWDWLPMYLFQVSTEPFTREDGDDVYYFYIFHQADTGFYDKFEDERSRQRLKIDEFNSVDRSETRLIFVLSKNNETLPYSNFLKNHFNKEHRGTRLEGDWIAGYYNLAGFINKESTNDILEKFNNEAQKAFGVNLLLNEV